MRNFLLLFLILLSIALITLIILQPRGGGAGAIFGGGGGEVYRSRRGVEKMLHYLTIVITFLFSAVALSLIFVH